MITEQLHLELGKASFEVSFNTQYVRLHDLFCLRPFQLVSSKDLNLG